MIIVAITTSAVFLVGQNFLPGIDPESKDIFLMTSSCFTAFTACFGIYSIIVTTSDGSEIHVNLIRTEPTDVTIWIGLNRTIVSPKFDKIEIECCRGLKTVRIKTNGQEYKGEIQVNGIMHMDVLVDHGSITVQENGSREENDYEDRPKTHMVDTVCFICLCLAIFIISTAMMFGEYIRWQ